MEWRLPASGDAERVELSLRGKKSPRPHQREAIDAVFQGFAEHDRGKLIMACGTGKTFTGLKIVERLAAERAASGQGEHTRVLFLVPSIALLSQTLREWRYETETPLRAFAVCSDSKVARGQVDADDLDMATHDLALPATTDPARLLSQMSGDGTELPAGLTVVFSTYQSIGTIAKAQEMGLDAFDLILCDEAHRTTGVTLAGHDESNFVRVHDNDVVRAARRLYMTATPRIYNEDTKADAKDASAELFRVTKMKIPKTKGVQDRTRIVYNHHITLENIPEEAYEYQLGARSAIEWIIDRYQVKTDPKSGILNDPNEWSDDPRYVVDLLRRIVTVSLATVEIVRHLPPLDIIEGAG